MTIWILFVFVIIDISPRILNAKKRYKKKVIEIKEQAKIVNVRDDKDGQEEDFNDEWFCKMMITLTLSMKMKLFRQDDEKKIILAYISWIVTFEFDQF